MRANPGQLRPERRADLEILDIDREAAKRPDRHASRILPHRMGRLVRADPSPR